MSNNDFKLCHIKEGIILHITNIKGGFGAGVAGAIAAHYPKAKEVYSINHRYNKLKLGSILPVRVDSKLWVVNLMAMPDYASMYNRRKLGADYVYLDYEALNTSLEYLVELLTTGRLMTDYVTDIVYNQISELDTIYVPYMMGSGNANGNWSEVVELLDNHLSEYTLFYK